ATDVGHPIKILSPAKAGLLILSLPVPSTEVLGYSHTVRCADAAALNPEDAFARRQRTISVINAATPTTIPIICEVERPVRVVRPKRSPRGSSRTNSIRKRNAA